MNRLITTATLLALTGAWTAAQAENESGFYVGGGVGQFNVQIDDIDDTDEAIERLDLEKPYDAKFFREGLLVADSHHGRVIATRRRR